MVEVARDEWTDRRSSPRVVLKTTVSFSSDSNFYTGFLDNISEGGIFIATHNEMPIGSHVSIEFTMPDQEEPISLVGEVRWLRTYDPNHDAAPPGLGLRFIDLTPEAKRRIETFVSRRGTLFYDDD